jgi:hypothetical protein
MCQCVGDVGEFGFDECRVDAGAEVVAGVLGA